MQKNQNRRHFFPVFAQNCYNQNPFDVIASPPVRTGNTTGNPTHRHITTQNHHKNTKNYLPYLKAIL